MNAIALTRLTPHGRRLAVLERRVARLEDRAELDRLLTQLDDLRHPSPTTRKDVTS